VIQSKQKTIPRPAAQPGACVKREEMPVADEVAIQELRVRLEQEHERLSALVAELERAERDSLSEASGENAYRDHMADQGSATFEREMDMTFEENERDALEQVQAALERIANGTYGTCQRCGAEIPLPRLEAMPTADLCIHCKEAEESR
jgi:DnaK suppressor protein